MNADELKENIYIVCLCIFVIICIYGIIAGQKYSKTDSKTAVAAQTQVTKSVNNNIDTKKSPEVLLTNNGYKSINRNYIHKKTMLDLFKGIAEEEKDLSEFFQKSKSIEDNTKLFEIFMDNLNSCENDFENLYDDKDLEKDYGLKISHDDTKLPKVINPKVNVMNFYDTGGIAYSRGLEIDYDYILKKYAKYLNSDWREYYNLLEQENSDWREYCNLSEQDSKELNGVLYQKYEFGDQLYKKWPKKWKTFLEKHPDFYLKTQIKNNINEYNELQ